MKAAILAGFVLFTGPNGGKVWIVPGQVVAVLPAPDGSCAKGGNTVVDTLAGTICVRESAADVVEKMSK